MFVTINTPVTTRTKVPTLYGRYDEYKEALEEQQKIGYDWMVAANFPIMELKTEEDIAQALKHPVSKDRF